MLIIFREESKGASSTLGVFFSRSSFLSPRENAKFTSAHSVGSPSALSSLLRDASEQSAMAAATASLSPVESTTVILFWVRVPVLSEQMTWVQPRVSTAVSFLITALCWLIFVTPMERTTVTTVASPSGMAATASDTATMNVFSMTVRASPLSLSSPRAMKRLKRKMNTHITRTIFESIVPSSSSFFCSGVSSPAVSERAPAIFPISVVMPVLVITAFPLPYTTVDPM